MPPAKTRLLFGVLFMSLCRVALAQEDDVADVTSQERRVDGDQNRRYFLIGPPTGSRQPKEGCGLIVMLAGGEGSAEFHPFMKRIYKNAVPQGYLAVQLVAVQWKPGQKIVWPTATSRVPGQKFTTEKFIRSVIRDVQATHKIDARKVFLFTWSSSGPAAYTASVEDKTPITGAFIAMSVFRPQSLGKSPKLEGKRYYLYHSPQDGVCPFRMAQAADSFMQSKGVKVRLATYEGGHGWRSPTLYDDIRKGLEWLDRSASTQPASAATTE